MNNVVWKYPLDLIDIQKINMPAGARILSVDNQKGILCLWAMVNEENPEQLRTIEIVGTGQEPIPSFHRTFIGTAVMPQFVWHVFERHQTKGK